jgi:hypothetical protein
VAQDRVSIGRELGAPLIVGLLHVEGHRLNVSEPRDEFVI